MKIARFLLNYAFTLIILAVSSSAFSLQSNEYNSGDTFVAFSESPMPASAAKIADSSGNALQAGLLNYNAGNLSFVYFDIPLWMQGNYTFSFGSEIAEFSVSDAPSIAIRPIAVYSSKGPSSARIDLVNKKDTGVNAEIIVSSTELQLSRNSIFVPEFSTRSLFVSWQKEIENAYLNITYGSKRQYKIPMIFAEEPNETISLATEQNTSKEPIVQPIETPSIGLVENLDIIRHTVPITKMINGSLHFIANKEVKNARFHLTPGLAEIATLNITDFPIMAPGIEYEQYIWINRYRNFAEGQYSGILSLDAENATSASIGLEITLTKPAETAANGTVARPAINKPSFNATNLNMTFINYTEEARLEKEKSSRNFRIGLLMIGILLIITAAIIYFFRPKPKELSFNEYVEKLKPKKKS